MTFILLDGTSDDEDSSANEVENGEELEISIRSFTGEAELEWQLQRIEKPAKQLIGSPDED